MRHLNRKSSPRVIGGVVLRKNNHRHTPNYWNTKQKNVVVDVEKPGKGFKHFLKKRDVLQFIKLIPNWAILSQDLDAIVLVKGGSDCDGFYDNNGVICISAWEKEQDIHIPNDYYQEHTQIFDRLGVKATKANRGYFCEFSADQIKAFQLLHILLHELGHHFDRMQTKSQDRSARGEDYAETFAYLFEKKMWLDYQNAFGVIF